MCKGGKIYSTHNEIHRRIHSYFSHQYFGGRKEINTNAYGWNKLGITLNLLLSFMQKLFSSSWKRKTTLDPNSQYRCNRKMGKQVYILQGETPTGRNKNNTSSSQEGGMTKQTVPTFSGHFPLLTFIKLPLSVLFLV